MAALLPLFSGPFAAEFLLDYLNQLVNLINTALGAVNTSNATAAKITAQGTFTANGATPVTVADANVTATSQILVTLKTVGGTVGTSAPNVRTITPATGFTIAGIALDTSVYNYAIVEKGI